MEGSVARIRSGTYSRRAKIRLGTYSDHGMASIHGGRLGGKGGLCSAFSEHHELMALARYHSTLL